jgi:hypothetical protein
MQEMTSAKALEGVLSLFLFLYYPRAFLSFDRNSHSMCNFKRSLKASPFDNVKVPICLFVCSVICSKVKDSPPFFFVFLALQIDPSSAHACC